MKQYLNKRVKLCFHYKGQELYFTALVLEITDTHITFEDKYKEKYTFKLEYLDEVSPVS